MISTIERFDQDNAQKLLKYKELFRGRLPRPVDPEHDPFKTLENYVRNSKRGKVSVSYSQVNERGRYFAANSCGLQSLLREIRGTIAQNIYFDIDMVNCHPMIYKQLCENADLPTECISFWCVNRDKLISKMVKIIPNSTRDSVKAGVLSILNGGTKFFERADPFCMQKEFKWLARFNKEVQNNTNILCQLNSDLYEEIKADPTKERPKSSTINILFCMAENKLLNIMIDYFRSVEIITHENNYVNCFDGIMVEKKRCKNQVTLESHIPKIEKLFKDAGFEMKLKIKPFDKIDLHISDEDMRAMEEKSMSIPISNTFDYKDKYMFLDFYHEFSNKSFPSLQELQAAVYPHLTKVIATVLTGDGVYIKKTDKGPDITRKLGLSDITMTYGNEETIKLSKLLKGVQSFSGLVCKLNNDELRGRDFNIWNGFQAERVDLSALLDPVKEGLDMMLEFILEVWASKDLVSYNYIISWFSGLVTNLNGINRVALAMISKEGCGKGSLTDFMKYILGNDAVAETNGIQQVIQKHNTTIQNKRIILINEMSSTKEEFRSNFDKIKSLITDAHVQIEPKGAAPYKIDNIGNYIMCSNHADSIIVSESDRRYAVFEASEAHINDIDYFKKLREKCFNQDVANAFYTYLLDFKVVPLGVIPQTNIRKQLQKLSLPTPLKFYEYVVEERVYERGEKVDATHLYNRYVSWCSSNGERAVTSTKFGVIIKSKWDRVRSNGMKYVIAYEEPDEIDL